jgi:anti-sigma B factor antagonist
MALDVRAAPDEFEARVVDQGTTRTISLSGEIDIASIPLLRETLDRAFWNGGFETILIDLADVTFLATCGVAALLAGHARSVEVGTRLLLLAGPPDVQRVFDLCGTANRLPFTARSRGDTT